MPATEEHDIPLNELLPWLEFACWSAIAVLPLLYYVNGPSVSSDQFVMRAVLVIVSVAGAITLRLWNRCRARAGSEGTFNIPQDSANASAPTSETDSPDRA